MKMPFESGKFDAATMGYGLRNVADIPAALSELCRCAPLSAQNRLLRPVHSLLLRHRNKRLCVHILAST